MLDELRIITETITQYEPLTYISVITSMAVALLCGFFLYLLYRFFYRGMLYSENFGILLVMITGTTALIFVTIGANLILSLGMIGALSIVRFRTAIKEPIDLGFLFLGIAAGLASGARLYLVAILGTITLGLVYIALTYIKKEKRNFLLILRYQSDSDKDVVKLLQSIRWKLKNKTISNGAVELTVEVNVKRNNTEFIEPFSSSYFISSAVLVEYNGDYT